MSERSEQVPDEAWALAEPTGELPRLGPVAAARAEAAVTQPIPAHSGSDRSGASATVVSLGNRDPDGDVRRHRDAVRSVVAM